MKQKKKKKKRKRQESKWDCAIKDLRFLEAKHGAEVLYRSALMCLIVALGRDLKRSDVPEVISRLVNFELLSFDRCKKVLEDKA